MKYLKNYTNYVNESVDSEYEWTAVLDKNGIFYNPTKVLKSELNKTLGFNRGKSIPLFLTEKECVDWCDYQNELMFQDSDR